MTEKEGPMLKGTSRHLSSFEVTEWFLSACPLV